MVAVKRNGYLMQALEMTPVCLYTRYRVVASLQLASFADRHVYKQCNDVSALAYF